MTGEREPAERPAKMLTHVRWDQHGSTLCGFSYLAALPIADDGKPTCRECQRRMKNPRAP